MDIRNSISEQDRVEQQLLQALGIPTDRMALTGIIFNGLGAEITLRRYLTGEELAYIHIIKEEK